MNNQYQFLSIHFIAASNPEFRVFPEHLIKRIKRHYIKNVICYKILTELKNK